MEVLRKSLKVLGCRHGQICALSISFLILLMYSEFRTLFFFFFFNSNAIFIFCSFAAEPRSFLLKILGRMVPQIDIFFFFFCTSLWKLTDIEGELS